MASSKDPFDFLARVMGEGGVESATGLESFMPTSAPLTDQARVEKTAEKLYKREPLDAAERFCLEAIIIPDRRPAILIEHGNYTVDHKEWLHLNEAKAKTTIRNAIGAVARVELPDHPRLPYGGTAFLVGDGLLMTNRHVAEIFCSGLGRKTLRFLPGLTAGIDFVQEYSDRASRLVHVDRVMMIHPYWDMAILVVEGIKGQKPLTLGVDDPDTLIGRDVAVIGYPAFDPRNDPRVQDKVFSGIYDVKRLQPGKVGAGKGRARADWESFGKMVSAVMHDASTLGGNSGSVAIDVATGAVVGLHFAGSYLDANYAVPAAELARDSRVVDAGVNFAAGARASLDANRKWWDEAEGTETASMPPAISAGARDVTPPLPAVAAPALDCAVSMTVPLEITVRLGSAQLGRAAATQAGATARTAAAAAESTEKLVEPAHDENYDGRGGYDALFLDVNAPPPEPVDTKIVSRLEDDSFLLHYEHFSVAIHKRRRLALFTASNLDASAKAKRPEDGKDYTRRGLSDLDEHDMEKWFLDPRIPALHQLPDKFFTKDDGAFDKGHIVRREDVAWGDSYESLRRANGDTYHVTNCSPQIAGFNRANQDTNWGELERFVSKQAGKSRLSLFAGPILSDNDRIFHGRDDDGATRVQIPSRFWKLVLAADDGRLQAYAFILTQDLSQTPLEFEVEAKWRALMVSVAALEKELKLVRFSREIKQADQFRASAGRALRAASGVAAAEPRRDAGAAEAPVVRTAGDVARGPLTFFDPTVSLFQSIAEEVALKKAPTLRTGTEAVAGGADARIVLAAETIAAQAMGKPVAAPSVGFEERMSPVDQAAVCAGLAWDLVKAKWQGNLGAVAALDARLNSGVCDPEWAKTIAEYYAHYGPGDRADRRAYVRPAAVTNNVIAIPAQAKIALVGDWATGAAPALNVLEAIRDQKPDLIIHLGDIYYSGTLEECERKILEPLRRVFGAAAIPPVFTLCGNHDMYCGGGGYYELLKKLGAKQEASFFCLRAGNDWQFLAMDTGRNDYQPLSVATAVTWIDPEEEEWLIQRVQEFSGKTVLLSHHQLFSAFAAIGEKDGAGALKPVNPNLQRTWEKLRAATKGSIPVWFWGHEHNLCVYQPYEKLPLGRCVGHGAIPVPAEEKAYDPLPEIIRPPVVVTGSELALEDGYYANGFAMLSLSAQLKVDYYQLLSGAARVTFSETIA